MPRLLVLSDLDRTLFDTRRFVADVWAFAGSKYGINGARELERASEFYDTYGDSYDYRFFDHLAHVCGPAYERTDFEAAAMQVLSGKYLYPDVTDDAVRMIDAIVTFGGIEYQMFKLSLSPLLAEIPRHIILQPKGEYIANTFHQPSVLIDDKFLQDEIYPPAHFIRIDRTGVEVGDQDDIIKDFSELSSVLQRFVAD